MVLILNNIDFITGKTFRPSTFCPSSGVHYFGYALIILLFFIDWFSRNEQLKISQKQIITIIKNISNVIPNNLCLKIDNGTWPQRCAYNDIDINKMRTIIEISEKEKMY